MSLKALVQRLSKRLECLKEPTVPVAILVAAAIGAFIWLIRLDSHLTFTADDWDFLVKRHGDLLSVVLEPFNGNTAIGPAIFFKVWLAIFGLNSATPYYVFSIAVYIFSCLLLFVYLRRRIDEWLALLAAVSILFLGAAFEVLLWVSPINFVGSMVAGLGMLLALDRGSRRTDAIAAGLLLVSIAFSSLGLAFAAGALVDILMDDRSRLKRAGMVVGPLLLYILWWSGWGHNGHSYVSLANLTHLPEFVFNAGSAGFTSLLGLASNDGSEPDQPHLIWGKLLFGAFLLVVAWRVIHAGRVPKQLAVILAIAFAFWMLAGINRSPERFPTSSRYQYSSAIFLLLIGAELARGIRMPRWVIVLGAVACGAAVLGGVHLTEREYNDRWLPATESLRYSLAAVEVAGESINPKFPIVFSTTNQVSASRFRSVSKRKGSPAYSESELVWAPEWAKATADLTLAQALGIALRSPGKTEHLAGCRLLRASSEGYTGVEFREGSYVLRGLAGVTRVELGRFATGVSVDLGSLPAHQNAELQVPADQSATPWRLWLVGNGAVRLCRAL